MKKDFLKSTEPSIIGLMILLNIINYVFNGSFNSFTENMILIYLINVSKKLDFIIKSKKSYF